MGARKIHVTLVVLVLAAAACTSGGDESGAESQPVTTDTSSTSAAGGTSFFSLGQVDVRFAPSEFEVASGETITVANNGNATHTFTLEDIDVVNSAGESQDVVIDLEPGTYDFVCRFHESSGMVGTLTVT